MKNWDRLEADVDLIMNKHYTPGRAGQSINKIVVHHNGGNLTIQGCWNTWQTREASAHYQVEAGGRIGQLVWDRDTAWHAANTIANQTSIGIEHANNNTSSYTISEATLDNGAHLVAALCKYYKLGVPTWMVNVFPHNYYIATGCPGQIAGSQNKAYMERARYWYAQMTGTNSAQATPQSVPAPVGDTETLAREVLAGKYGNGDARKAALGVKYAAVQARVNEILLGSSGQASPVKSTEELAREVIRGEWGNGQERANRLAAAGYSYSAVQARVNQILLG